MMKIVILLMTLVVQQLGVIKAQAGYVDVMKNYMSEGIAVHYGYIMNTAKYKMFRGVTEDLNEVYQDDILLYPKTVLSERKKIFLEIYELGEDKYLQIYELNAQINAFTRITNVYYELGSKGYERITMDKFRSIVKGTVSISLDIQNEIVHPFIKKERQEKETFKFEHYTARKTYLCNRLGGRYSVEYGVGKVYDSRIKMFLGHKKIKYFTTRCESIKYLTQNGRTFVIIHQKSYKLRFEKRRLLGNIIWIGIVNKVVGGTQVEHLEAFRIKQNVDYRALDLTEITLDISESVSPELMKLEKLKGFTGEWEYRMYETKQNDALDKKIKLVIDSEMDNFMITRINENVVYVYVEVYTNPSDSIVVTNSVVKVNGVLSKEIRVFKKKVTENRYEELESLEKILVLRNIERNKKVYVDINIDEEQPWIIENERSLWNEEKFRFYRFRHVDRMGNQYGKTFILSNIWHDQFYEYMNVEIEGWIKRGIILKKNLNSDRLIIIGENKMFVPSGTEFENYPVVVTDRTIL